MLQFNLKALLLLVALAAVVCAVLFALPAAAQTMVLLVGVVALPGPLLVAHLRGSRRVRTFALGGLAAYAAWSIVIAMPVSFDAARQLNSFGVVAWSGFLVFPVPSYTSLAGLKLPWLMVLAAGLLSLAVDWLMGDSARAGQK